MAERPFSFEELLEQLLPGSTELTVRDALGPARGPIRGRSGGVVIDDVSSFLQDEFAVSSERRWLIHGDPGFGKTLLSLMLMQSQVENHVTGEQQHRRGLTVVDALDELLAAVPRGALIARLTESIFRDAVVVTCRTNYYGRYLRETDFVKNRRVIELLPWQRSDVVPMTIKYLNCSQATEALAKQFIALLHTSDSFEELCRTPLHLCMAVSAAVESTKTFEAEAVGLLELYEGWLEGVLQIEAAKGGSCLDAAAKSHMLELLAWQSYDLDERDDSVPYSNQAIERWLSRPEIVRWCSSRGVEPAHVFRDLTERTVLVPSSLHPVLTPQFTFRHRTLQDMYVALHAFHALSGQVDAQPQEVFKTYLGPDVWVFLQLMLLRVDRDDKGMSRRICRRGMAALQVAVDAGLNESDEAAGNVLREQLGHYLGHLDSSELREYLRLRLKLEPNPWVRRGTAIGLSFGGDLGALDAYVEVLRSAKLSGPAGENETNRGAHLSFYGDQPFAGDDDRDLGFPHCDRTLRRLVRQLEDDSRRASWRIDLYSLLDIALDRPQSHPAGRRILSELVESLRVVHSRMTGREDTRDWPEVRELGQFLGTCDPNDGG